MLPPNNDAFLYFQHYERDLLRSASLERWVAPVRIIPAGRDSLGGLHRISRAVMAARWPRFSRNGLPSPIRQGG